MTLRADDRPIQSAGLPTALAALVAGSVSGLLGALYSASFALVLFAGPLAVAFDTGVRLGLAGAVIFCIAAALRQPFAGILWQPQSIPVIVMAKALVALSVAIGTVDPARLTASALVLVGATTVVTGLVLLAVGAARVAQIARSVPYPVIGGFMAATGLFLLLNGAGIAAGDAALSGGLAELQAMRRWLPPLAMGVLLLLLARRLQMRMVLPAGMVLYVAVFYTWAAQHDGGLEAARVAGLLVGSGVAAGPAPTLSPTLFLSVDWAAVLAQAPLMITVAGLTLLGVLLNLSGIEQVTGRPVDMNRELRAAGIANLVTGAAGAGVGYPSTSLSLLSHRLTHRPDRLAALAAAVVAAGLAWGGPHVIGLMPRGVFALILAFLGTDFLMTWLWDGAKRLPRKDYAIVLLILIAALAFGFIAAVAIGVIMAAMSFTVSYSMIDAIRARTTGRLRVSAIERSERHALAVQTRGNETVIYELQGYLFFGTANSVLDRIVSDTAAADGHLRHLVLDFRRVQGIDISAGQMFSRLGADCHRLGLTLHLCGMGAEVRSTLAGAVPHAKVSPTLDQTLVGIEDHVLATQNTLQERDDAPMQSAAVTALLHRAAELDATSLVQTIDVVAGETVLQRGALDQTLVILERGRLAATLPGDKGQTVILARFLPGAIVGEIAFCTGAPRTADIVAETDCSLRRVTRSDIDRLAEADPETAIAFHQHLAQLMAKRLMRTTALLRAYE